MKLIITMLMFLGLALAEDSVVSSGFLKFPNYGQYGGIEYQVMCIDGYKFLVVTRSVDSVSVTQMREITIAGYEKLMKCRASSESK